MELIINHGSQMIELGEQLGRLAVEGDVIYLTGELGMGKTTLVKGIGRGLGCEESITSPTFTLMNIYTGRLTLYHCDFYRLSGEDAQQLGIKELIGMEGLFVVEWAEATNQGMLPAGLRVKMELAGDDYDGPRRINFEADGQRAMQLLKELKLCHC